MTQSTTIAPTKRLQQRDEYWDALRGVAIFSVIAIHTSAMTLGLHNYSALLVRQLAAFAVPLFLFISGYWMRNVCIMSAADYIGFMRRRITKVLIPYLTWSCIYIAFTAYWSHTLPSWRTVFIALATGSASTPFYFILLILQFYLLLPILQFIVQRLRFGLAGVVVVNIVCLLTIYYLRIVRHSNIPFVLYACPCCNWILYFCLGLMADRIRLWSVSMHIAGVIASFMIALGEGLYLLSRTGMLDFATSTIRLGSLLYSSSIILLVLSLSHSGSCHARLLAQIGRYSFGIYFVHMLVLMYVNNYLHNISWLYALQPLYILLSALATTAICCGIIALSRILLPRKILKTMLAFGL